MATSTKLPPETEAGFLKAVLDMAKLYGWKSVHFRPAKTAKGWRTAVQGDGKGWVDLVLVRPPRIIFAELKTDKGKLTAEQEAWIDALGMCVGVSLIDVCVWRPADWPRIEKMLAPVFDCGTPLESTHAPTQAQEARRLDPFADPMAHE